jgi:hypothetical protein
VKRPETFTSGFRDAWGFWTLWAKAKPSAKDLGGAAATVLYLGLVLLASWGFWGAVI